MHTATQSIYDGLDFAFQFLNERLFDGALPPVAITLQRKAHSFGYHHAQKFVNKAGQRVSEIALNPDSFQDRSEPEVLSTLVHEMVHEWQMVFGDPPRGAYHDAEFAAKMEAIGLMCSDTGKPGGKKTGQHMSHYIIMGGQFEAAATELTFLNVTAWSSAKGVETTKPKSVSKVKYTCGNCGQNAWAKPDAQLVCGDCSDVGGTWWPMEAQS
jgi:predicted SprT family Zn-dependent metalloprotease